MQLVHISCNPQITAWHTRKQRHPVKRPSRQAKYKSTSCPQLIQLTLWSEGWRGCARASKAILAPCPPISPLHPALLFHHTPPRALPFSSCTPPRHPFHFRSACYDLTMVQRCWPLRHPPPPTIAYTVRVDVIPSVLALDRTLFETAFGTRIRCCLCWLLRAKNLRNTKHLYISMWSCAWLSMLVGSSPPQLSPHPGSYNDMCLSVPSAEANPPRGRQRTCRLWPSSHVTMSTLASQACACATPRPSTTSYNRTRIANPTQCVMTTRYAQLVARPVSNST